MVPCPRQRVRIEDRDHVRRLRRTKRGQTIGRDIPRQIIRLRGRPQKQQAPRRGIAIGMMDRAAGFVERDHLRKAIGFLKQRGRPTRGVIAKRGLTLPQMNGAERTQRGACGGSGNAAAYNQKIDIHSAQDSTQNKR